MNHNPETDAAAFLGGEMSTRAARRFEAHLVSCEDCWQEVAEGRRGRIAAESLRETAPQSLRETIRALVLSRPYPQKSGRFKGVAAGVAALALLMAAAVFVLQPKEPSGPRQPASVAKALSDFTSGRIPAEKGAARPAPDLSEMGFSVAASGGGTVGHIPVDGFSYRDSRGRRVQIYLSATPFPEAAGALRISGNTGPWMASGNGVRLLCAEKPIPLLALSRSPDVLTELASHLKIS